MQQVKTKNNISLKLPGTRLFRYFLLISFAAIVIIAVGVSFGFKVIFTNHVIEEAEKDAVRIANGLYHHEIEELGNGLFAADEILSIPPENISQFDEEIHSFLFPFNIVKTKIFNNETRIVYSTDLKNIGKIEPDNIQLQNALHGSSSSKMETNEHVWSLEEERRYDLEIVESYVPITTVDGRIIAAMEIYKDVSVDLSYARKSALKTVWLLIAGIIIVFGILAFLMSISIKTVDAGNSKLMVNEEKMRSILENAPDLIANTDRDGNILFINRTISGISSKEVIGQSIYDFILPENHQSVQEALGKVFETGAPQKCEFEIKPTGADYTLWQRASFGPVLRKNKVVGVTAISADITELKQHEEILNELKTAIEQAKDGIAIADLEGNFKFVNETWAEMHGYSVEEIIGKNLRMHHTSEQMENEVIPIIEEVKKTGFKEGEVGHVTKDGTIFPTWMSTSLLKNKDDEPVGLVKIVRDITEQKKMEEALHERMAELEEFNRMATGREMKMIELKGEINQLRTQLEKKEKYEIVK